MTQVFTETRAPRNKTITLSKKEVNLYRSRLMSPATSPLTPENLENKTVHANFFTLLQSLPSNFVDLLFIDPPYNLTKSFNTNTFRQLPTQEYTAWFESWFPKLLKTVKPTGSVYVCGDWRSAAAIQSVMERYLMLHTRITWEREKGRGAKANWKNCSEDIWFGTVSKKYTFNVEAVKLRKRVIAPYTTPEGKPKDWERTQAGDYRLTHPSNLWTDLTIPYWSMPENTDHSTQKPEKLLAKIVLASSNPGDFVLDPFLGSGTTSVVAKKLGRRYAGIETDETYCCLAEHRLHLAERDTRIQGYTAGVFWERNTLQSQKPAKKNGALDDLGPLFEAGDVAAARPQ